MKLLFLLLLSATTVVSHGDAPMSREFLDWKFTDLTTGIPPAHVKHWLRIRWIGAIAHPIIPAFLIDENRKPPRWAATRYVVMDVSEYLALAQFTHSFACSAKWTSQYSYPDMKVDEFYGDRIHDVCVLFRGSGCSYLFGLASLKEIDWAHRDTRPLAEFEWELKCPGSHTPSHDATGRSD